MKVLCIDNSDKPENIPEEEWLEEGKVYTISDVVEMNLQKGKLGISLEEIQLTEASAPYEYYSLERFLLFPFEDSVVSENVSLKKENNSKKEIDIYAKDADLSNLN
tara:strand:+ start:4887 stop:5204 length:318 start_codon:yes stop_codon:yes gene_type:complete